MTFLRNTWYAAMWAQELPAGELRARTLLGEPLVFFRKGDGSAAALADECPHRFAPLHRGQLCEGDRVRCPYHGLEFDALGRCVRNPHGNGFIPPNARVASYPVIEKHTMLWIWMGSGEPDMSRIPDYRVLDLDSPYVAGKRDCLTMRANYRLITDNLLDLSHVSFLHEGILGNAQTVSADIEVVENADTITVTRLMQRVPPPALFDLIFRRDGKPVDMWASIRWNAPGCMLNDAGVKPVGAPKSDGTSVLGSHILTPESETSTLYHFCAVRQNPIGFPADEADAIRTKLDELRRFAFAEQDAPMIEAQQAAWTRNPARKPTLLAIDAGCARYARRLDALIAAEQLTDTEARRPA